MSSDTDPDDEVGFYGKRQTDKAAKVRELFSLYTHVEPQAQRTVLSLKQQVVLHLLFEEMYLAIRIGLGARPPLGRMPDHAEMGGIISSGWTALDARMRGVPRECWEWLAYTRIEVTYRATPMFYWFAYSGDTRAMTKAQHNPVHVRKRGAMCLKAFALDLPNPNPTLSEMMCVVSLR